jgi:hypothetical protein
MKGKIISLDWNTLSGYGTDDYELYELSHAQTAALISLCQFLYWRTRWITEPPDIDAFASDTENRLMTSLKFCERMILCIENDNDVRSSLVDFINDNSSVITNIVNNYLNVQKSYPAGATISVPGTSSGPNLKAAALAVTDYMYRYISDLYERAETINADRRGEMIAILFGAIPGLETLPFDELLELVNWNFEIQVEEFEADYDDLIRDEMACNLRCLVSDNSGFFSYEVWGNWLAGLSTLLPGNKTAEIFSRFAPISQVFLNQVLQQVNGSISLRQFFNQIYAVWLAGLQDTAIDNCICAAVWELIIDFTASTEGYSNVGTQGAYVSGQGWGSTGAGFPYEAVRPERTYSAAFNLTQVEVEIGNPRSGSVFNVYLDSVLFGSASATSTIVIINGNLVGATLLFEITAPNGPSVFIRKVTLRGTGTPPTP